jgi:hypothetical protein
MFEQIKDTRENWPCGRSYDIIDSSSSKSYRIRRGCLGYISVPRKNTQNIYMTSWDVYIFFYNFSYQTLRGWMIICSALLPFFLPKCLCIDFYLGEAKIWHVCLQLMWANLLDTHMHTGKQNKIEFVREPFTYIGRYSIEKTFCIV